MTKPPQRFVLTLVPNRDDSDPEGFRRLRLALKRLLRCWGLRCTKIEYPDFEQTPKELPSNDL